MKTTIITAIYILLAAPFALAMDPATYFEIEVAARQITIDGMQARLACMQDSDCPSSRAASIDEETQTRVVNRHLESDISPSRLAAYYSQNTKAINDYLAHDLNLQITLNQLTATFDSLSDEINALLEQE